MSSRTPRAGPNTFTNMSMTAAIPKLLISIHWENDPDKILSTIAISKASEEDLRRFLSCIQRIIAMHLISLCSACLHLATVGHAWILQVLAWQSIFSSCAREHSCSSGMLCRSFL